MKKTILICALIVCLILPSVVLVTYAHPGGTDSSGGHRNRSTGEYHYHHGYSAHDHYDVDGDGTADCPYDFDDKTERKRDSDTSGRTASGTKKKSSPILGLVISGVIYVFFMFVLPLFIINR